jgi:ribosomal protein S27E
MKRPHCPRCKGFITKRADIIRDEPTEFIYCMLCGWRHYRPQGGEARLDTVDLMAASIRGY